MKNLITWARLRRVRQVVQLLALALFVYLLFAALQRRAAFPLADLFFRLDPLAAFGAMLATRAWIPRLALALVTLGLTLALGRVWCGWLCPLGTLMDWVRLRPPRRRSSKDRSAVPAVSPRWRMVKNFVLLLLVTAALFGNLSLLILDPLTLFTRTMTTAIIPALNYAVTAVERALYSISFLRPAVDWAEGLLRGAILPVEEPVVTQNALIVALFVGILALNAVADRFWCRYLCPLGALLGLVSKLSLLRPVIRPLCNRCGRCSRACRVDAIVCPRGFEIVTAECVVCLDCLVACPERFVADLPRTSRSKRGIGFQLHSRPAPLRDTDPTRRQALAALATSAAGVVVLRTGVQAKQPHPLLIRPPGVEDEQAFLARCLRCSQCMKVCPTSGLQPALLQSGLEGLWTPTLVPRLGYCDYGCNACGQVCPSGAIPSLDLARKREAVIGIAAIDRDRCLPWARGIPCIVCEEMCPTPQKAIRLEQVTVTDGPLAPASGSGESGPTIVQCPYVLEDLCIGCGVCEHQCPVEGEAAIRVYR